MQFLCFHSSSARMSGPPAMSPVSRIKSVEGSRTKTQKKSVVMVSKRIRWVSLNFSSQTEEKKVAPAYGLAL